MILMGMACRTSTTTCPLTWNADCADSDADGYGDACDACPGNDRLVYVKLDATGAGDGSSWADAYTDLDAALMNALPCDQIWIAVGEYVPPAGGFVVPESIQIYGGFAGGETALAMRDIELNEVLLSADVNGDDDYTSLGELAQHDRRQPRDDCVGRKRAFAHAHRWRHVPRCQRPGLCVCQLDTHVPALHI